MCEPDARRIHVCLTPNGGVETDRKSNAITFSVDVYVNGELQGTGPLVMSTVEAELLDARLQYKLGSDTQSEPHGLVG
jgi:hypothetical protein